MPFSQRFSVEDNQRLRVPQRGAWVSIRDHFAQEGAAREVGIVLPVGCGKSGLIAITPLAARSRRTLVIAPGRKIRGQLSGDLRANSATNSMSVSGSSPRTRTCRRRRLSRAAASISTNPARRYRRGEHPADRGRGEPLARYA